MSTPIDPASFAWLLRRHRLAAGLTQEELAERAHLSARAISDLERGLKHTPRRDTVALLAEALALSGEERSALEEAARTPRLHPSAPVAAAAQPTPAPDAQGQNVGGTDWPAGIVTFLLTDIEESTALWDRQPEAMRTAIVRHDAIIEGALAGHGGRQIKERGEGDSIFAVFSSPGAALAAAIDAQRALRAERWSLSRPIRVRMGLHSGEATQHGIGYYGATVNRTARVRSLGHGGQILLSAATAALVQANMPDGASLRALGLYALKGFALSETIYQVMHGALPSDFPPLAGPQAPRHNLPSPVTTFVGRRREQEEVHALLAASRLTTLTGIGGVGKTRLVLEVAQGQVAEMPDGVWLVELAALTDATLLPQQVAAAMGLRDEPGRPILATLLDHLTERRVLLVLDSCEHLIAACADLATAVLRTCPLARMLITSREELNIGGEICYRVPPLRLPDPQATSGAIAGCEAVELFVERAKARRADFALTEATAPLMSRICARLDGIPLAIELAAARAAALSLEQIAARLEDSIRLLATGSRTAERRQQTLQATLDWSYDLLDEGERMLFQRLAVFQGGWTLDAAEAVCVGTGVDAELVLDLLTGLIHKSLVELAEVPGSPRYRLLETVRHYSMERLEREGGAGALRERHLRWCLSLAMRADEALTGNEQGVWLRRLEHEHENLRAALAWGLGTPGYQGDGLQLAATLWRFWSMRGYLREGRRWLEQGLSDTAAAVAQDVWARALRAGGRLALEQGEATQARRRFEESLAVCRERGDLPGVAAALHGLGHAARWRGESAAARAHYEESLSIRRQTGDTRGIATSMQSLGDVAQDEGDYAGARTLYEQSLGLARRLGDQSNIAWALHQLSLVAHGEGHGAAETALLEESLAQFRDLQETPGIAAALLRLGRLALAAGDLGRARAALVESLRRYHELGSAPGMGAALEGTAAFLLARGHADQAARLFSASAPLHDEVGARPARDEHLWLNRLGAALREALGEAGWQAAVMAGSSLGLERAVQDGLAFLTEGADDR